MHSCLPDPEVMDSEFLQIHKSKIQKLFQLDSQSVPFSTITRDHLYPQIGGKANSEDAKKFLRGLQLNGIGTFHKKELNVSKKPVFIVNKKENVSSPSKINLYNRLGL